MGNISKLSHAFHLRTAGHNTFSTDNKLTDHLQSSSAGFPEEGVEIEGEEELVALYTDLLRVIEQDDQKEFDRLLFKHNLVELFDRDTLGSLLLKACECNAGLSIVNTLLDLGADVDCCNPEQSNSCLMMAAKNNNLEQVEVLIQFKAKINMTDNYGWSALFYGSYFGCIRSSEALLDAGANVNLVDQDGMSCLIWAAGRGHREVVELLIKYGAQVNSTDRYSTSALIWASRKGNAEIVDMLLKNGADVNERGMYGWTPLAVAVKGNHIETTKLLLQHRPIMNTCDGENMTPLLLACRDGFEEIALELIEAGAFVNQSDTNGNTPLIFAAYMKCPKLVEALVKAGAFAEHAGQDERNAIHWSVIRNDVESFQLFLKLGINTNLTTSSGDTYLLLAAKHRSWDVIKLLHDHNSKDASTTSSNEVTVHRTDKSRSLNIEGAFLKLDLDDCPNQLDSSNELNPKTQTSTRNRGVSHLDCENLLKPPEF